VKIIFICEAVFPENKGGLERWFGQATTEIAKRGHEVIYLNASGVNEVRNGVHFVSVTSENWHYLEGGIRSIRQSMEFAYSVGRFLLKNSFDGVYCAQAPILTIPVTSIIAGIKRKIAIVEWFEVWSIRYWIRYRGLILGAIGWIVQFVASQFGSQMTVFTPRAKSALEKMRLGRGKGITILDGLVGGRAYSRTSSNKRMDVIFLGRLVAEKQPQLALRAIELFLEQGWTGKFWLVGQGPLAATLRRLIEDSKHRYSVQLVENASDDLVADIMKSCFLLIHPSRREGYGLSIVEAAAHGVPALLINYSDNAAVDLGINPDLVAETDHLFVLVNLMQKAFDDQDYFRDECYMWTQVSSSKHTMTLSAIRILAMLGGVPENELSVPRDLDLE